MGRIKRALGKIGRKLQFLCCFPCFSSKTQRHTEVKQTNANRTAQQPDNSTKVSPVQSPTRERKICLPVPISQHEQQQQDELEIKAKLYIASLLSKSFPLMSVVTVTDIVGDETRSGVSSENETVAVFHELPNNFVINCNSKEEIVTSFRELPYDLAINCNSEEEVVAGFHELPYDLSICYNNIEVDEIDGNNPTSSTLGSIEPSTTDECPVLQSQYGEVEQSSNGIELKESLNSGDSEGDDYVITVYELLSNTRLEKNHFGTSKNIFSTEPTQVQVIPNDEPVDSDCHSVEISDGVEPPVDIFEQYRRAYPSFGETIALMEASENYMKFTALIEKYNNN